MPDHIHNGHHLHTLNNIPEPSVDGEYILRLVRTGGSYIYSYAVPIVTGSGAPSVTPAFIGQDYLDTTNKLFYKAGGTTDSGDWELINGP